MKEIIVVLDHAEKFKINAHTYNDLERALKEGQEKIVTTQVSAFSVYNALHGYQVIATNGVKSECLNQLLDAGEVRLYQNAPMMLMSGCFGLIYE